MAPGLLMFRLTFTFVLVLVIAGTVLYSAAPIDPAVWSPPRNPGLSGQFAANRKLGDAQRIVTAIGNGPEAVACGSEGERYTGFDDGRIVRFEAGGKLPTDYANTGGRPLGMKVAADGRLIVADAVRGLIAISDGGKVEVLAADHDGTPMRFVDDLDIDGSGRIWFSDASQRYGWGETMRDFLDGTPTGRLLSYDPESGSTEVHIDGLFFANGVAVGPGDAYVLINETGTGLIHRLWLKGEQAGERDLFHRGLPGTPDNITFNGSDRFWVAMPSLRASLDFMADKPWLRRLVSFVPDHVIHANTDSYSFVVGLDLEGKVVANLQDSERRFVDTTSAVECDGGLYIGSLNEPSLAFYSLQ